MSSPSTGRVDSTLVGSVGLPRGLRDVTNVTHLEPEFPSESLRIGACIGAFIGVVEGIELLCGLGGRRGKGKEGAGKDMRGSSRHLQRGGPRATTRQKMERRYEAGLGKRDLISPWRYRRRGVHCSLHGEIAVASCPRSDLECKKERGRVQIVAADVSRPLLDAPMLACLRTRQVHHNINSVDDSSLYPVRKVEKEEA